MSRVGKLLIEIPSGVEVAIKEGWVEVKGPKGTLREKIIPVSILGGVIIIVGVIVANGRLLTFLRHLPWRNKKL